MNMMPARGWMARGRLAASAFTLIEVMIASGILFVCLFAILGVVCNCLRNARSLQRQNVEMGSVAGQVYCQLANTNKVAGGTFDVDVSDTFPDFSCSATVSEVASNGLCQVDIVVQRRSKHDQSAISVWMYLPQFQESGLNSLGGGLRR
jgi:hypothetical protein